MPSAMPELALPSDQTSERFLLQTAIQWDGRLREAIVKIKAEHFALMAHRQIWLSVAAMFDKGVEVSRQTVLAYFTESSPNDLKSIGGIGYLSEFMEPVPDVSVETFVSNILDTFARRQLMFKCNEALSRLQRRDESLVEIAAEIEEQSRVSVSIIQESSGFKNFEDMIIECGGLQAFLSRGKGDSISYPWPSLTRMTNGGIRPGQLIILAGPSGKGKTTMALNIVFRAAYSGAGVPLIFSLEMSKEEIGSKLLSLSSGVDSFHFDKLTEYERDLVRTGRGILQDNEYMVDDEDAASMAAIRSKVKSVIAKRPVSLVVIDTVQLVEGRHGIRENREQEIAAITRSMKRMAMKLNVPILAISQLNETESGKEPELKNLRDSRTIGHNANIVMFLHFTRQYDMRAGIPTGELDLIIAKHRGGPEGRLALDFHAPTGRFYEKDGVN